MTEQQIKDHILFRKAEKQRLIDLWNQVERLNKDVGLKQSTLDELQDKISSKIAQCEISIRDHEKLLNP